MLGSGRRLIARERTTHSRFSFSLPAGSYTLIARTGGLRAERQVRISADRTLRANVVIAVP